MNEQQKEIIRKTADYAKKTLGVEATGHDWFHVQRVWLNARLIGKASGADLFIVELAALLHDIADWKFHGGDTAVGPAKAKKWLEGLKVDRTSTAHITSIVKNISFKGAKVKNKIHTLEGRVVQDADRLDAIGAIGIARAFAYGGATGREIHNPGRELELHSSAEAYSKNTSPTINHFHEKLLLLKDRMNTKAGKELARDRHEFMRLFLRQFDREVSGRKAPEKKVK
ncbi:MAG TPA: HD domain-containing protein [Elusimicrobiales bacterium]|nr:HD domain-containing protein [Elusimicrobiales bacterium]